MMRNLVTALVEHEWIVTTNTRAKDLRFWADKLIHICHNNADHKAKTELNRILYKKDLETKVREEIAPRFTDKHIGGFTRITNLNAHRKNDKAELVQVEYIGNALDIEDWEDLEYDRGESEHPTFWDWQDKIL